MNPKENSQLVSPPLRGEIGKVIRNLACSKPKGIKVALAAFSALIVLCCSQLMGANPFVHPLFSSHMVLQRDAADPVWGWTTAGNTVTVVVKDQSGATLQTKTAIADSAGRWQVAVGPFGLVAGNAAYSMTISAPGQTTANFNDVLIGDVLLCSGQSNMAFSLNTINVINLAQEIADSANYPQVRCFTVPQVSATTPQATLSGGTWLTSGTATTGNFSATAYFTAREIYKQQGVPVGIVVSAWPGTMIQSWTDIGRVSAISDFSQLIFDQAGQAPGSATLAGLFNGMIAPLSPLQLRAVEWYQGEYNAGAPEQYSRLLPDMMDAYTANFGQPNLPFIIIQLPNINGVQTAPVEVNSWAELRETQQKAVAADPDTRLVTTIDLGGAIPFNNNAGELHPKDKQDVGLRAARAAANLIYGQNVVNQGPMCTGATVSGSTIICSFNNVGAGLMSGTKDYQTPLSPAQPVVGGTLKGFAIAGSDHTFYAANANISGTDQVLVSSPSVSAPLYVRYGWGNNPQCNLYNMISGTDGSVVDGLPAGSFRNDPINRLNVNAGTGSATFYSGTQVAVSGSLLPGQTFQSWSGDTSLLANPTSQNTTANVSQKYVSVRANYAVTAAPTGLSATAGISQVTLNWAAMTGVHYNLKRATSLSGTFSVIAPNLTGTTSFVDSSALDGVPYYYVVSALNPQGEGPDSPAVTGTTIPVVHNVRMSHVDAVAQLAWDPIAGSVTSYNVKRSTTSGGPYSTIAATSGTVTSFTDANVVLGGTYYYVVTAVNASGECPNSLELPVVPTFLPMPMQNADVGSVGLPGGAYSVAGSGAYTVVGAGKQLGTSPDSFNFTYLTGTGNCAITARVATLGVGGTNAQVGVMIRSTLAADSPYARTYVDSTKSYYQGRSTAGGGAGTSVGSNANRWVRVVRTNNSCVGYTSADGQTWIQQGTPVTVSGSSVYIGFAVCSQNPGALNTSVLDNVSWTGAVASPMTDDDIGPVGVTGAAFGSNSTSITVLGSGSNIGISPDSFNFACTPLVGDCTITARIASLGSAGSYPEVGVMVRASLNADAAYARTYVNPTKSFYQGRYVTGGGTGTSVGNNTNRWVRVVRTSGSCVGYTSADGQTWIQQGTPVAFAASPVYVGLAVCSRNNSVLNTTVFDNITITGTPP